MDTKRLLMVARRIESLESEITKLKAEARAIVAGQGGGVGRVKRTMSAAAKRKISEAMRRRWAAIKKKA